MPKLKLMCWLLVLVLLTSGGAAVAWWAGLLGRKYTGDQLTAFEKQVDRKREEAYSVGRSSIAVQMAKTEAEDIERILRAVAAERESLKIELGAKDRVTVIGDRNAPAAVPESPD